MEINVELDNRTGKSQVVSTALITPEVAQERGFKVFDDGRKSVYALHPDGSQMDDGEVGEMTSVEVEELLRQATDEKVPTDVQYHQPVYSAPYIGSSGPSTPRTPSKAQRHTLTPSHSPFQNAESSVNGTHFPTEELEGREIQSPNVIQRETELPYFHIQEQPKNALQSEIGAKSPTVALVSIKATSEGMPAPIQPIYRAVDSHSPSLASLKSNSEPDSSIESSSDVNRASCAESSTSLNLPDELSPVTMIFMGYENAEEEEEEDIQAELIVIPNSDEDDDGDNISDGDESVSYHPQGYKSKVFQPKLGIAKVRGHRDIMEDIYMQWDNVELHKPTFIHKPSKHGPYLQVPAVHDSANAGSISMEEMKLCSTGR